MSRLSAHREKQFKQKVFIYTIVIVGFVFFMFTIGLRLLINTSLLIGSLTSKRTVQQTSKKDVFFGSLSVDSIPTATNSARIIVSGTVTNYDLIEFYINGEKVEEQEFPSSESFSEEIGILKVGDNEVYLKAKSKQEKHEKSSEKYTVTYKSDKPKLEIKEPNDNTKTKTSEIKVSGTTSKEVYIKVDELPIVVTADGSFQTNVQLTEGENKITVVAEDNAGNIETKTLTVTREKSE